MNVSILRKAPNEVKYKVYVGVDKVNVNFCAFVNGAKSAIAEMVFRDFAKYGNAFHKCPIGVRALIMCQKLNALLRKITFSGSTIFAKFSS